MAVWFLEREATMSIQLKWRRCTAWPSSSAPWSSAQWTPTWWRSSKTFATKLARGVGVILIPWRICTLNSFVGLRPIVILTKIDRLCKLTEEDTRNVFNSKLVLQKVFVPRILRVFHLVPLSGWGAGQKVRNSCQPHLPGSELQHRDRVQPEHRHLEPARAAADPAILFGIPHGQARLREGGWEIQGKRSQGTGGGETEEKNYGTGSEHVRSWDR